VKLVNNRFECYVNSQTVTRCVFMILDDFDR